jgi:hypothetical protein
VAEDRDAMTKGEFVNNVGRLLRETPHSVTGSVVVDQIYAHYQHAHPEFKHPRGGEAFYLSTPLFGKMGEYYRWIADEAITTKGVDLRVGMVRAVEDLSTEVYHRAPWEFDDLRRSAHPTVTEDGTVTYDRLPEVGRLSDADLKAKDHLRYLDERKRRGGR